MYELKEKLTAWPGGPKGPTGPGDPTGPLLPACPGGPWKQRLQKKWQSQYFFEAFIIIYLDFYSIELI